MNILLLATELDLILFKAWYNYSKFFISLNVVFENRQTRLNRFLIIRHNYSKFFVPWIVASRVKNNFLRVCEEKFISSCLNFFKVLFMYWKPIFYQNRFSYLMIFLKKGVWNRFLKTGKSTLSFLKSDIIIVLLYFLYLLLLYLFLLFLEFVKRNLFLLVRFFKCWTYIGNRFSIKKPIFEVHNFLWKKGI